MPLALPTRLKRGLFDARWTQEIQSSAEKKCVYLQENQLTLSQEYVSSADNSRGGGVENHDR